MKEYFKKIYGKCSKDYFDKVSKWIDNNEKKFIITANPETVMMASKDDEINKMLLDDNNSVIPDGIAIVKAGRMLGFDIKERIAGVDVAEFLFKYASDNKKSVYLFGSKQEVIDNMKKVINDKYPGLKLLGATNGYVKDRDKEFEKIKQAKPDIVMVALGIPHQERLIYKHLKDFKKGIFIGVGGSFDVLSGTKKRAPKLFIKTNTEWLYRIICEPKRLKRFWNNNIKFIFEVKKECKSINIFNIIKKSFKDNWPLFIVILLSLVLHIMAMKQLGINYNINSDDVSYLNSGIRFLNTGEITMHGVISAQIMPGMTFLIAFLALFFGTGYYLIFAIKILWLLFSLLTIVNVYKSIRLFSNKFISIIPCVFLLSLDYIWMDNISLTETPYLFLFSLLIYLSLKIAKIPSNKTFILIIVTYICAVFIRPNIGIFPVFLFLYLLLKKYDFKLLIKRYIIAGIVLFMCLLPWTYRNYKVFGEFIPLTYGVGNPLLLGTYQGVGYPLDEDLDYVTNVDNKMSAKMKKYYYSEDENDLYLKSYYSLIYDRMVAKYRMQVWWEKDKLSMLKSYLYFKPYENFYSVFYWDTLFNVESNVLALIRKIEIITFIISSIIIIFNKKYFKELLFIGLLYLSQILLYSYTFAYSRYAITMFFLRYIIIGIGLSILYNKFKNRRALK